MIMGLSSILLQIISLRQLLTVFSGNELDMGITLSVWLTTVGIGSFMGHKFRIKNAFPVSFIAVALFSQITILLANLIRPVLMIGPGETLSLTTAVLSTTSVLMPLCLAIGFQFPLAVSYLEGNPSKTYGIEAIGAFIGGALFTFILSGRLDAPLLSAIVCVLNILTALLLLRKKAIALLFLIPLVFYFGFDKINAAVQWKGLRLVERVESRYGEISVLKLRGQFNIYSSGKFQFSYPDPQVEELKAHLTMPVHPSPSHILIVGGSPSVLKEFIKYPLSTIDFLEIDPKIIKVSFSLLSREDRAILEDKRIRIFTEDARKFIKGLQVPYYDLIILNLPEPATANINRFYTKNFFHEAKTILKENGILALTLPTSVGYIGRRMQTANGSIYNSLQSAFKNIEASSEEYGYLFASDAPLYVNPDTLSKRFSKNAIAVKHFSTSIFYDAFSPLKADMVKKRLGKISAINTDMRPVAYLYNLMLWAEIHGGGMLNYLLDVKKMQAAYVAAAVLAAIAAVLWRKKQAVYFSIFTTGYSVMAFSMAIILSYQSLFGYVYETIGLLTAAFMIGMASGALIIKETKAPLRLLRVSEAAAIIFFILSLQFLSREIFFYSLSLFCGIIGGIQFFAANQCIKGISTEKTAGKLYASDLAGSSLGAFSASVLLMPLWGVQNTLMFLVLIKTASLILLFSVRHEKP